MRGRWEEDPSDEERLRIVEAAIPHVERQLALVRGRQATLEEFAGDLEAKLSRLRRRRRDLLPAALASTGMAATPRRLTFGAHATAYERARPAWPEPAARWLVPDGAELVVELGAGTGKLTRAVSALGTRVVAVEPDPRMLAVLHGLGLEGVEGSAEAIPFDDAVADAVVAGSSLHWFELEQALPEIHRVLRPGGRFAFGWNHRDDRHPAIARMGETVYAAQARRPGPRWRSRDWAAELTESGLFRDVEHALFEHVHELPREALARPPALVLRGRSAGRGRAQARLRRGGAGPRLGSVDRRRRHAAAAVRRRRVSRDARLGAASASCDRFGGLIRVYAARRHLGIASATRGSARIVGSGVSRAELLRRGAVGGGALLVSASGLSAFAGTAAAAAPPDADLAYLRLLIAAELLGIDFQTHALASRKLHTKGAAAADPADARRRERALREARGRADRGRADAGDLGRHRLLLSEGELPQRVLDPEARRQAGAPDGRVPTWERPRTSRRRSCGCRSARSPRTRRSMRCAGSARGQVGDREGRSRRRFRWVRCPTPWTSSRASDAEAGIHRQRSGRSARDQRRHAPPLGPQRPDQGHARRQQPAGRARRRRSTGCAATARGRTSPPATASAPP